MSYSILSVVVGIFAFISGIIVIPVIGLALGANALLREKRKEKRQRSVLWMAGLGIFINIVPICLMLIFAYL
jgi:hypothetical protein